MQHYRGMWSNTYVNVYIIDDVASSTYHSLSPENGLRQIYAVDFLKKCVFSKTPSRVLTLTLIKYLLFSVLSWV
jgi:hypothetical protein